MTTQQQETLYQEGPATAAMSDKAHDVVQVLNEKLDSVWRYDQYIEDCEGDEECAGIFRQMKEDDMRAVESLRQQVERMCREGTFR